MDSMESHLQFAEDIAPDLTFLTDADGQVMKSYGIDVAQYERGYFVIDSDRKLHYQYIAIATLLENQTGKLLMEVDKMTGTYTGNPDDYTSGGLLVTHENDGNALGNHAIDFSLQAQCGADLTLYDQLEANENGVVLTFFGGPSSEDSVMMFSEFKENINEFSTRGFGVIGINKSIPEENMAFAESLGVGENREITFFSDQDGKVGQEYGVYKKLNLSHPGEHETAYFIIDSDGVIQYKVTGRVLNYQAETLIRKIDRITQTR